MFRLNTREYAPPTKHPTKYRKRVYFLMQQLRDGVDEHRRADKV